MFPSSIQLNVMDCGPTCLQIVSKYYGKHIPIEHLRTIGNASRIGTSLLGISKAAEEIGFRATGLKLTFDKLATEVPLPVIVHWNQKHFVVVYKINKKYVFLSDPASGLVKYTHKEFITNWIGSEAGKESHGICLSLEPTILFEKATKDFDVPGQEKKLPAFIAHYLSPHKKILIQIGLTLIVVSIIQLMFPFLTQNIVDVGISKRDIGFIWLVLTAQLFLTFGQVSAELMRGWMLLYLGTKVNIALISDFFVKLMNLPINFFDTRLTGDLMQRINDHQRIESFLTSTSLNAILSVFTILLYSIVLAFYDITLFLVFISGSILYVVWLFLFFSKRRKLDIQKFEVSGDNNSKIIELINGMQEIKLHNAEQNKRWEWERIQVRFFDLNKKTLALEQTQATGSRIIHEFKNIFTTIIAATLVIKSELTLGMMLAVSYIIGQLNTPVLQLVPILKSWQDAKLSLVRIMEIHKKRSEQEVRAEMNQSELPETDNSDNAFLFKNVSFYYTPDTPPALKNINIAIPFNKVTAIVGASGSGKTTMLKLLMQFYAPTEGVIFFGNNHLLDIDIEQWRANFGVVMQEGFIFNDTIMGNIAVTQDNVDMRKIEAAAHMANMLEFIRSLPNGFNTKIGTEGLSLSTGQKQRILIARAIYKNPDMLFFDEATSALDAGNEKQIMENLNSIYSGKTVIIIAHRLSTVKNADKIIVLDKGEVVEVGNHKELSDKKGYYYTLVKNQLDLN